MNTLKSAGLLTAIPESDVDETDGKKGLVCRYRFYKRVLKTEIRFGFYLRPLLQHSGGRMLEFFHEDFGWVGTDIPNDIRDGAAVDVGYTAYLNWEYGVYDDGEWSVSENKEIHPLAEKMSRFWEYEKVDSEPESPEKHVLFSVKEHDYECLGQYRFETVVRVVKSRSCPELAAQFFEDAKDPGFRITGIPSISNSSHNRLGVRDADKVWRMMKIPQ